MDLTVPFRGSLAVAGGALTRNVLFGPRLRRLLPDVYVGAEVEVGLLVMSLAAAVATAPDGVLSGYSAAEVLGASCARRGAPPEVTVPPTSNRRGGAGRVVVHRDRLLPGETTALAGTRVTTPQRTAYDLVRRNRVSEGVVALDVLARRFGFDLDDVRRLRSRHLGAPGTGRIERAIRLADPRSESPMETRIRVAIVLGGLPAPVVQHPVCCAGRRFRLDLAYPAVGLAIEYDGRHHLTPERATADLEREALLVAAGWTVLRFRAGPVLDRPDLVAAGVRAELARRGVPPRPNTR